MNYFHSVAPVFLLFAGSAMGQVAPAPTASDPHRAIIAYEAGQVVQLRGALGYQVMIELAADEEIKSVAVGDSGAWQVNLNNERDRLFVRPVRPDARTNMTVVTSVRTYSFDLEAMAHPDPLTPYTIAFRYPSPQPLPDQPQYVDVSSATRRLTKYRISGDQQLRPDSVSDDGRRTYIVWPRSAPIPATYARGPSGREVLVNGTMGTDDVYVVDGVPRWLTFRIDHSVARAERIFPRKIVDARN